MPLPVNVAARRVAALIPLATPGIDGGRRSNFQHGYITYSFSTGATQVAYY